VTLRGTAFLPRTARQLFDASRSGKVAELPEADRPDAAVDVDFHTEQLIKDILRHWFCRRVSRLSSADLEVGGQAQASSQLTQFRIQLQRWPGQCWHVWPPEVFLARRHEGDAAAQLRLHYIKTDA